MLHFLKDIQHSRKCLETGCSNVQTGVPVHLTPVTVVFESPNRWYLDNLDVLVVANSPSSLCHATKKGKSKEKIHY